MVSAVNSRRDFLYSASFATLGLLAGPSWLQAQIAASGEKLHTVRKGDTLSGLARLHGVPVGAIRTRNQLKSDVIRIGQRLVIPAPASAKPPAVLAGVIAATRNLKIKSGRWRYVVTHHAGIEAGNAKAYDAGHRRRGMEHGLAYHFVIGNGRDSGEGQIEIGPRWLKQIHGGHVSNQAYNEAGIGICLVGNFETRKPSAKQLASFTALVDWLRNGPPLGVKPRFTVHRWVDRRHTVCPGRHFPYAAMERRYPA